MTREDWITRVTRAVYVDAVEPGRCSDLLRLMWADAQAIQQAANAKLADACEPRIPTGGPVDTGRIWRRATASRITMAIRAAQPATDEARSARESDERPA